MTILASSREALGIAGEALYRVPTLSLPDPGFHAMMGHNIDLCEAMFVAWDACFNKGRIPHPLKEIIRVQLSRAASCSY